MFKIIQSVTAEPGFRLQIFFDDFQSGVIDLEPMVRQGGVFAPLRDPNFFAKVTIQDEGRSLGWPTDIDLCADALWNDIQTQRVAS